GVYRRRQACGPIAHAEDAVGQHRLPVVERRLLQPRFASERGCNPVVARQHLVGDLSVARLISANQSKVREAEEKQEPAESGKQEPIGGRAGDLQMISSKSYCTEGLVRSCAMIRAMAPDRGPSREQPLAQAWPPPPNSSATAATSSCPLLRRLTRNRPSGSSRKNIATSTSWMDSA